jgi:predicted metal-dependent hydrolase
VTETIRLGDVEVLVSRKAVKHAHLSVHPPVGRVTLVTPLGTRLEVARAFAASRMVWIRAQQAKLRAQARETPRQFVTRESHYLWGRRYLLTVVEANEKPGVVLSPRKLTLRVRPGSSAETRAAVMHAWHKALLHEAVPALLATWQPKLRVKVNAYFLQRMKTKWGSCNTRAGNIRLNTELVKKPRDLLEYVVVHELAHLRFPNHGDKFRALLDRHYPAWREARAELNALPLGADSGAVVR